MISGCGFSNCSFHILSAHECFAGLIDWLSLFWLWVGSVSSDFVDCICVGRLFGAEFEHAFEGYVIQRFALDRYKTDAKTILSLFVQPGLPCLMDGRAKTLNRMTD